MLTGFKDYNFVDSLGVSVTGVNTITHLEQLKYDRPTKFDSTIFNVASLGTTTTYIRELERYS